MKKIAILFGALISIFSVCKSQNVNEEKVKVYDSTAMASPGLRYQQRPKFLVVSYDRILATPATSLSDETGIGPGAAELEKVEELKFKLKAPLKWKGRTKFFTGVNYYYQEYNFVNPKNLSYDFYEVLENRHLNSLGLQLYMTHSFKRNRFFLARLGGEMNGDYRDDFVSTTRFIRTSLSALYGWKKSEDLSYGFGIYWNYDLGGPSIYPAFMYNRNFSEKWGIEGVFPKEIFVRWNATSRTMVYGGYEVSGSTFQLVFDDPAIYPASTLQLQRSNIRALATIEQEIHDFIWLGFSAGYHFTVNMDLSAQNFLYTLDKELIDTRFGPAPFVQVQLFLVPPAGLSKRALDPKE